MDSAQFDFIMAVKFADFFSARYRKGLELKDQPHPNIEPLQALLQVHYEKRDAVFNGEEPVFKLNDQETISYDEIALALGELNKKLLTTQVDLIVSIGKPLGGGKK
jgi:hypothetical protein